LTCTQTEAASGYPSSACSFRRTESDCSSGPHRADPTCAPLARPLSSGWWIRPRSRRSPTCHFQLLSPMPSQPRRPAAASEQHQHARPNRADDAVAGSSERPRARALARQYWRHPDRRGRRDATYLVVCTSHGCLLRRVAAAFLGPDRRSFETERTVRLRVAPASRVTKAGLPWPSAIGPSTRDTSMLAHHERASASVLMIGREVR
jgi:hypothetical protein